MPCCASAQSTGTNEARQARQRAERARHDETIQRCRDLSGQLAVQVEEKRRS
jgi:hypothetical protein